jgi:hypothetical protein
VDANHRDLFKSSSGTMLRQGRCGSVVALSTLLGRASCSLLLSLSVFAFAQSPSASSAKPQGQTPAEQKPAAVPMTAAEKRKADLQADTEKLYKLTQELKAEVDKSNKDTLSVSVVKKAQEVERLAKSIKERSKNP